MSTSITHQEPLKIGSHYAAAQKILRGEFPWPRMVLIQPTYVCDHQCGYCMFDGMNEKYANIAPKHQWLSLLQQFAWLNEGLPPEERIGAIDICGGGEPLLAPYMLELYQAIVAADLKFGQITNGTKLKGDLMKFLVDHGTYCRVSLDTVNPEAYTRTRTPGRPDTVKVALANIEATAKYKAESGSKMDLSVKVLLSRDILDTFEETLKYFEDMPLTYLQVKVARDWEGAHGLTEDEATEVQRLCVQAQPLYYGKIVCSVGKGQLTTNCFMTPIHSVIDANGECFLCCYYFKREADHSIGNVFQRPFREVWTAPRHWEAIRGIDAHVCNVHDCKFFAINAGMQTLLDASPEFV